MDTENREKMEDRRWIREAGGRRYLTAFDVQSTPENSIDSETSG